MIHKKIKILGVAPYEGMKSMMLKLAAKREDIDLTVFVGDLNEGVEIAKRNFHSNFDVIISRGGTAEMISEATSVPLIEINLSVYDILRSLKLAENYSDRYAIVGYPSITGNAQLLCDLLQYKIDIFTIHSIDEVQSTLEDLKTQGYRMILCDMITTTIAKKLGLNAMLITSGEESIMSAFDQATKLFKSYVSIKEDNRFLEDIIRSHSGSTVVFDTDKNLVFSSVESEHFDQIVEILKAEIDETLSSETHKCFKTINEHLFTITSKKILNRQTAYAVFYFTSEHAPSARSKYGIKYSNRSEVEDSFFNSFYSVTNTANEARSNLEQLSANSAPIMVVGEGGTGKTQIARLLYTQSPSAQNPFITIDCTVINDKGWSFLTNHHNSPLNDTQNTLFFKDLHVLSEARCKHLLEMIRDVNVHKQNKLIFSYAVKNLDKAPNAVIEYLNQLYCMSIQLQPLKERTNEIPTLSSLYLNTLNLKLAKQLIGFEPEALSRLQAYHWPYNYTQFKRVLEEMAVITATPYITAATVQSVLEKEKSDALDTMSSKSETKGVFCYDIHLNRTLDEINHDIISLYLEQSGGNHSTTAKRLGISRTTLWRYLK
ncbi:sigma-54-dependent Fis family transcriptional regulator [Fusibacter sp. 3D3]|uniref:sigma-54-dependent Fis family transcriptional regulator n=1 Tax=Fusibacter sp. 3D3 TaxID=1048380 RepID=UPI00085306D7|nr:sigma-54-dependent transcriptional regulator [Fusibacter sp. 3D3]GAU76470.1 propionate catabolism operon regulatory protein PrpR [Fusibacter sp. 3D3]